MSEMGEHGLGNPRRIEHKDKEDRISITLEIDREFTDELSPKELAMASALTAGFAHSVAAVAKK